VVLTLKLYIAEKPALGRVIVAALPKPQNKQDVYIKLSNGNCIIWCSGHLLEQAEPDAYEPSYKKWQANVLPPIIPSHWQLKPNTIQQLITVRKLHTNASEQIHTADPYRSNGYTLLMTESVKNICVGAKL